MVTIIITLIIAGVCLYLVERVIPMDAAVRIVLRVVVVLLLILFLLNAFGIVDIPAKLK